MGDKKNGKPVPFEGIDFSDCKGQCGTLPCCSACMKEKERLAEEMEMEKRARKTRDWED